MGNLSITLSSLAIIILTAISSFFPGNVFANEAFTVSFGQQEEAKTIGDLKPRFIPYEKKTAPDVSIQYVMKRYRALFEKASTPAVRIEALNRLNNLSASYGIVEKDLTIDPYVEAEVILDTFQHITDTGEDYHRMDELLYLTAKATYFIGETLEAIKRLELLVGLYEDSEFAEEALFRLAEMHFELAEFNTAKTYYERLLKTTKAPYLRRFGLYKLAWSQFRLDDRNGTFKTLSTLVSEYSDAGQVSRQRSISSIDEPESNYRGFDLPDTTRVFPDTMRLFAINSLQIQGDAKIEELARTLGGEQYESLALIALTTHLEIKERGLAAANLTQRYITARAPSVTNYEHALYVIDTQLKYGATVEAWKQKTELLENYGARSTFWKELSSQDRSSLHERISTVTEELAHLNYVRMQQRKSKDGRFTQHATLAAEYYLQLGELEPDANTAREHQYLAAQALDQAGFYVKSIALYEDLAYQKTTVEGEQKVEGRVDFNKSGLAAYRVLLAHKALDDKGGASSWTPRRIDATQQFLLLHGKGHNEAPVVAQALADQFIQTEKLEQAILALALLETFDFSTPEQKFASLKQRAQLYYNTGDFVNAEHHYRSALTQFSALRREDAALVAQLKSGIANSLYQQAETAEQPDATITFYLALADEFPEHALASSALFNAGEHYQSTLSWKESISVHERFISQYPDNKLRVDARKKLITAFQNTEQLNLAAFNLMQLAESTLDSDIKTASRSSYQAALYYKELNQLDDAKSAFNWFISNQPQDNALVSEAKYYFYQQANSDEERLAKAEELLSHIDRHDLNDARSSTLGAEAALTLASVEQDEFQALAITLPFEKSIKAKTRQLERCTKAYTRVLDFGVAEYASAARFNMAYIYQSLAHDIMNSQRPKGLSELELEQYEILLEEQAIPIEEQAIELHETNIKYSRGMVLNEWVVQSFTALETLNPSMYKRPIIGPSYAEDIH